MQFKEDARKDRQKDGRTEGWTEGWMEGWKDGQTLFYRTLLATARGPKKEMTIAAANYIRQYKLQFS